MDEKISASLFLVLGLVLALFGATVLFLMLPWPDSFVLRQLAEGETILERVPILVIGVGYLGIGIWIFVAHLRDLRDLRE